MPQIHVLWLIGPLVLLAVDLDFVEERLSNDERKCESWVDIIKIKKQNKDLPL